MMKAKEAIERIKSGESMEDVIISDLETMKLGFRDALLLTEHGFGVPAGNIAYHDEDVASDPEFDEVEWDGKFKSLAEVLEAKGMKKSSAQPARETIMIELSVEDEDVLAWLKQNNLKLERLLSKLVVDLYHTEQMLHAK